MTGSCTNVQHSGRKSDLGVFSAIARHAPLFFLHAGDIHYANLQVTAQEARSPDLARALYLQEYDRVLAQPRHGVPLLRKRGLVLLAVDRAVARAADERAVVVQERTQPAVLLGAGLAFRRRPLLFSLPSNHF